MHSLIFILCFWLLTSKGLHTDSPRRLSVAHFIVIHQGPLEGRRVFGNVFQLLSTGQLYHLSSFISSLSRARRL